MTTVELDRVTNAIWALDGQVVEARMRMRHGEPRAVRVIVGFERQEDALLFEQTVLEAGATPVICPPTLAGGRPVPVHPVAFAVPAGEGRPLLGLV